MLMVHVWLATISLYKNFETYLVRFGKSYHYKVLAEYMNVCILYVVYSFIISFGYLCGVTFLIGDNFLLSRICIMYSGACNHLLINGQDT